MSSSDRLSIDFRHGHHFAGRAADEYLFRREQGLAVDGGLDHIDFFLGRQLDDQVSGDAGKNVVRCRCGPDLAFHDAKDVGMAAFRDEVVAVDKDCLEATGFSRGLSRHDVSEQVDPVEGRNLDIVQWQDLSVEVSQSPEQLAIP